MLPIVERVYSWKGTPFRLFGRVRGVGADCSTVALDAQILNGLKEIPNSYKLRRAMISREFMDKYLTDLGFLPIKRATEGCLVVTQDFSKIDKPYNHMGVFSEGEFYHFTTNGIMHVPLLELKDYQLWKLQQQHLCPQPALLGQPLPHQRFG